MLLLPLQLVTTQQSTIKYNENVDETLVDNFANSSLSQSSSLNKNNISISQSIIIQSNITTTFHPETAALIPNELATSTISTSTVKFLPKSHRSNNVKVFNKIESKKLSRKSIEVAHDDETSDWKCPNISQSRNLECGCDMPHTLRCSGDIHSLEVEYNLHMIVFQYIYEKCS